MSNRKTICGVEVEAFEFDELLALGERCGTEYFMSLPHATELVGRANTQLWCADLLSQVETSFAKMRDLNEALDDETWSIIRSAFYAAAENAVTTNLRAEIIERNTFNSYIDAVRASGDFILAMRLEKARDERDAMLRKDCWSSDEALPFVDLNGQLMDRSVTR